MSACVCMCVSGPHKFEDIFENVFSVTGLQPGQGLGKH